MTLRQMVLGIFCLLATAHAAPAEEMLVPVTGEVTVNGRPLASGRIFFYLDDDQFVGSSIKDGAFRVTRVPVGDCRVEFEGEGVPRKPVFKVNVKAGMNTFDFDMKRR